MRTIIRLISLFLLLGNCCGIASVEVIHVPATNMTKQDGSQVVFSTDRFESFAFIRTGDEIKFYVTTSQSGMYTLHASVSSPANLGAFAVTNSDTSQVYGAALSLPPSASWDEWNTVTIDEIALSKGTHPMELTVVEGGWKIQYLYLVLTKQVEVNGPHHYMVPGFDLLDFYGVEYYPYEKIVARIDRGDWFAYNLPVKKTGNYTLHFWVASPEGRGSFRVLNGATKKPYASIRSLPTTGDWLDWAIVHVPDVQLSAGVVPINISVTSAGWNFCMLSYELEDTKREDTSTGCGLNLAATDLGIGESITFTPETLCDNEGISFETSSEGGLNIGWLDQGNWVAYDVNLARAGVYDVSVRYSSVDGDGGFEISNQFTGALYQVQPQLEKTGDWQAWSTLQNATVSLPSGTTVIQLTSLEGGWNLQWIQLTRRDGAITPLSPPGVRPVNPSGQVPALQPSTGLPGQTPGMSPTAATPVRVPSSALPVVSPVQPLRPSGQAPTAVAPLPSGLAPGMSPTAATPGREPISTLPVVPIVQPLRPSGQAPGMSSTATNPAISSTPILPAQAPVPLQSPTALSGRAPSPARSPFISPTLVLRVAPPV